MIISEQDGEAYNDYISNLLGEGEVENAHDTSAGSSGSFDSLNDLANDSSSAHSILASI